MSFLIAVYVNEGIVLAGDRRTTHEHSKVGETIQHIGVHTPTDKIFLCPNGRNIHPAIPRSSKA